jgi:hypothetical protein
MNEHPETGASRHAFAYDPARVKVIACATVIEEMEPLMPAEMPREVLDFGLHSRPSGLTAALQEAIDRSPGMDAILLGYGLCSRGVVGLHATHCRLVIPRVDDCIAIFLGSKSAYQAQARKEPGTYYLTKGWIEVGDSPFDQADRLASKYGARKADWMVRLMLRNYKRLAFIDTGARDIERYRERAKATAERFGLRFEEIEGAPTLVDKLLFGPWDDECVVVEQGGTVTFDQFTGGLGAAPAMPNTMGFGAGPAAGSEAADA